MPIHRARSLALLLLIMTALSIWRAAEFRRSLSQRGIGIRTDSVAYIWSARNLADGAGLGRLDGSGAPRPMTHWPPLYPLVLGLPALAGIDPLDSARWLNLLLVVANPLLAGLLVYRASGSVLAGLAVDLTLLFSPVLVHTHLFAMSEPLYLFLTLAALFLLLEMVRAEPGRRAWLVPALGACLGLAFLTRYAGLALVLTALVTVLLAREPLRIRLRSTALLAGLAFVPMLAWLVRNTLVAGTATNRSLMLFPIQPAELQKFLERVNEWFLPFGSSLAPDPIKLSAAVTALALLAAWVLLTGRPGGSDDPRGGSEQAQKVHRRSSPAHTAHLLTPPEALAAGAGGAGGAGRSAQDDIPECHPEQSEGSTSRRRRSFAGAQDDMGWKEVLANAFDLPRSSRGYALPPNMTSPDLDSSPKATPTQIDPPSLLPAVLVLLLHLVLYSSMVLISRLLFDATIPLDEQRIWSPAYVSLVVLAGLGLAWAVRRLGSTPLAAAVPLTLVLAWAGGAVLQGYAAQTTLMLDSHYHYGSALEHIDWVESPLLMSLRDLSHEPVTYTNNIEVLYYHSGRYSYLVDGLTPALQERLRANLAGPGVLVVLFTPPPGLVEEIEKAIPELDVAYHGADGTIFIALP